MTTKPPEPDDDRHLTAEDLGPLVEDQWGCTPLREDQQHLKRHLNRCEACSNKFGKMISAARFTV